MHFSPDEIVPRKNFHDVTLHYMAKCSQLPQSNVHQLQQKNNARNINNYYQVCPQKYES